MKIRSFGLGGKLEWERQTDGRLREQMMLKTAKGDQ